MRYILNKNSFKMAMSRGGFESILDFSRRTSIHRNTILGYLSGKGVFMSSFNQIADELRVDPLDLITALSDPKAEIQDIKEIAPIIAAIIKRDADIAVVLIGSRVGDDAKKFSDWDIGLARGQRPLTGIEYLSLKGLADELSEDIVRTVDIVNLDAAPLWFLESIDYDPVFLDGNTESFVYFKGVLNGIQKR